MVDPRSLNKHHATTCLHFLFTHIVSFACTSLLVSLSLSPTHLSRLGSQVFAAGNVSFPQLLPKVAVLLNWKIFRFLKSLLWRLCIILVHIPMVFDVFFWFLFMLFIMNDSNYMVMLKFTAIIYLVLFCDKHSNRAFVNTVYCKYRLLCKVGLQ